MNESLMSSTLRKLIALIGIFVIIGVWIAVMTVIGASIVGWPGLAQLVFYIFAGVLWVVPCKPILEWARKVRTSAN